jgi:NitT/TauT family transport system substrate-binding protein
MRFFLILLSIFLSFSFSSCSKNSHKEKVLKIATNSWIGYAPLFYAKEKGYLKQNNIKLLMNVSLAEAAELYSIGKADMVTTTQHELYALQKDFDIIPTILIDRSYGGDMILSNKSISELQKASMITTYLEIDSINAEILQSFLKIYNIPVEKLNIINKDQAQIEDLKPEQNEAILIVTYVPYNILLQKRGFKVVTSTKDIQSIVVIDSLCTSKKLYSNRFYQLKKLKAIVDQSIDEIMSNTKESYLLVKKYLGNLSYEEYLEGLKTIKWINKPSRELLERIEPMGYESKYIIQ